MLHLSSLCYLRDLCALCGESRPLPYFLTPANQFTTTVIGASDAVCSCAVLTRNRCPSGETSYQERAPALRT